MASVHGGKTTQMSTAALKGAAKRTSWRLAAAFTAVALLSQYCFAPGPVRKPVPSTLESCLNDVCAGRSDCVRFADNKMNEWVRPFNLGRSSVPAAVVRPRNAQGVADVVKCAVKYDAKVQAKAGGHSFGNHGLGGEDGAVSVDLEYLQYVSIDSMSPSQSVRVGGGTRLGQIDEELRPHQRAIPHGVHMGIGIGGHATVGGLGPMSRMWGTTLDHVEEVEVVTANGTIVRANERQNPDLFFALRGAGAGFGIVTEFVMRTRPVPQEVLHYNYDIQFNHVSNIVDLFYDWQTLIADPALDRRLGTKFTVTPLGARISATWYGTEEELSQSRILDRLPGGNDPMVFRRETWDSSLAKHAAQESFHISDVPSKFFSKSVGFTRDDVLSRADVSNLFHWANSQRHGSSFWSLKFEASGGTVSEVPMAATAYAHRDKFMFYQSYAVAASKDTTRFLDDLHRTILNSIPRTFRGTYPGFVDPELRDAQRAYWGSNLPALEGIKETWDPMDVFHNPQSVCPKAW